MNVDLSSQGGQIKVTYLNLNSICVNNFCKVEDIKQHLKMSETLILGLGETKLDQNINDRDITINGFQLLRKDFNRRSGGVLVYLHNSLSYKRRADLEHVDTESIWIEILGRDISHTIGFYYRNFSQSHNEFNSFKDNLYTTLNNITHSQSPCTVLGDFNCHNQLWDPHAITDNKGRDLKQICDGFNFLQLINEKTYFSGNHSTLVDLIFTNSVSHIMDSKVDDFCIEKHCSVSCILLADATAVNKPFKRKIFNYECINVVGASSFFSNAFNTLNYEILNTDSLCNAITNILVTGTEMFTPSFTVNTNDQDLPWINNSILCKIKYCNACLRRYRKNPTTDKLEHFKVARNQVTIMLKKAKEAYYIDLNNSLTNARTSNKKWHRLVNQFIKKGNKGRIPTLKSDNVLAHSSYDKANVLNSHFGKISRIDTTVCNLPEFSFKTNKKISTVNITETIVLKNLKDIDCTKSIGPDKVSPFILKKCAEVLAPFLTKFFNKVLTDGSYPQIWKNANVVPIFKSGDPSNPSNYRPISLTSVLSKVFERIIHSELYQYVMDNKFITPNQSGFIRNDSCTNRLFYLVEHIYQKLEEGKQVPIVFLDIKKAFDKVWHAGLLHKLKTIGITGKLLKLLESYLHNRRQQVVIEGVSSATVNLLAGVPQGGILSTLLFLLFINDISEATTSPILLFADDTSIYTNIRTLNDNNLQILQNDLVQLEVWARKWCIEFNSNKCKLMVFCRKNVEQLQPTLHFLGQVIEIVDSYTYLGLTLDSRLYWSKYIDTIIAKSQLTLNIMKTYKYKLSRNTLKVLYILHARSIIDYASIVISNLSVDQKKRLETIQYNAMLIVSGAHYGTSEIKMRSELGWLTLEQLRNNNKLIFLYKLINDMLPDYLNFLIPQSQVVTVSQNQNQYNLRALQHRVPHALDLVEPHGSVQFTNRPIALAIRQWNSLNLHVREALSVVSFKNKLLKTFDLQKCDYHLEFDNYHVIMHNLG